MRKVLEYLVEILDGRLKEKSHAGGVVDADGAVQVAAVGNVHEDSLICLGVLITILISIPILLDIKDYFRDKKNQQP